MAQRAALDAPAGQSDRCPVGLDSYRLNLEVNTLKESVQDPKNPVVRT